jgi:hypothetical protein
MIMVDIVGESLARYTRVMKGALPKTSPLHRLSPRPSLLTTNLNQVVSL